MARRSVVEVLEACEAGVILYTQSPVLHRNSSRGVAIPAGRRVSVELLDTLDPDATIDVGPTPPGGKTGHVNLLAAKSPLERLCMAVEREALGQGSSFLVHQGAIGAMAFAFLREHAALPLAEIDPRLPPGWGTLRDYRKPLTPGLKCAIVALATLAIDKGLRRTTRIEQEAILDLFSACLLQEIALAFLPAGASVPVPDLAKGGFAALMLGLDALDPSRLAAKAVEAKKRSSSPVRLVAKAILDQRTPDTRSTLALSVMRAREHGRFLDANGTWPDAVGTSRDAAAFVQRTRGYDLAARVRLARLEERCEGSSVWPRRLVGKAFGGARVFLARAGSEFERDPDGVLAVWRREQRALFPDNPEWDLHVSLVETMAGLWLNLRQEYELGDEEARNVVRGFAERGA